MHRPDPFFKALDLEMGGRDSAAKTSPVEFGAQIQHTVAPGWKERSKRMSSLISKSLSSHTSAPRPSLPTTVMRKRSVFEAQSGNTRDRFAMEANVVEPLRMLHRCICYFLSHPELYGTNIRSLLERELVYVMRIKSSETALLLPTPVPVADVALPPISTMKPKHQGFQSKDQIAAQNRYAGWVVSPQNLEDALSPNPLFSNPDGIFGYGGTSFVEATPGFLSLIDKSSRKITLQDGLSFHQQRHQQQQQQPPVFGESPRDSSNSVQESSIASASLGPFDVLHSSLEEQLGPRTVGDEPMSDGLNIAARLRASPAHLLIDGAGYEVCFLRNQLQQVEAAYNAKCIGLHELRLEHNRNLTELTSAQKKIQHQSTKLNEMRLESENMRRELDAWKQRASELNMNANANSNDASAEVSRRLQAMQLSDSRRELANLMRLWRETEKSLQETKRSLESAEKESALSHNYLADAFFLVERLERRVERRDAFIETQRRRQSSLEEKYEKLIWCFQELETLRGGHSYVDFLLAEDPIWSLFLFVRLQRHVNGYSQVDGTNPLLANSKEALPFRRTPAGGKFLETYSPSLLQARVTNDISTRRIRRDPSHGDFSSLLGCHVLRWRGAFTIDYLGGYPSTVANLTELPRRSQPILSLTSLLLLPPQSSATSPSTTAAATPRSLLGAAKSPPDPAAAAAPTETDVQNSQQYSQATVRLILYSFWNDRLAQYKREMERRVAAACNAPSKPRSRAAEESSSIADDDLATNDPNAETPTLHIPTFLAALVHYVQRLFPTSGGTGGAGVAGGAAGAGVVDSATNLTSPSSPSRGTRATSPSPEAGGDSYGPSVAVRGVLNRVANTGGSNVSSGGSAPMDGCRVFHAMMYSIRAEDGTEAPLVLSPQARELLYALCYYAEEYKESDADFYLFYLVAHQQLPELVAINFYASMEALRAACDETLRRHINKQSHDASMPRPTPQQEFGTMSELSSLLDSKMPAQLQNDTPVAAIERVVEFIDSAPLIGQGVDLEPDSDGEGYGCILPGQHREGSAKGSAAAAVQAAAEATHTVSEQIAKIKHDISAYLFPEASENKLPDALQHSTSNLQKEPADWMPPAWVNLDGALGTLLGSHSSLLKAFNEARSNGGRHLLETQSRKRRQFVSQASTLSAARGLLPCEEVMGLLQTHCFATYALSCCGTPRFSLFEALCPDKDTATALTPLTPIGQLPPTEFHMRRLRFAMALDQPSTLVYYPALFEVDPKYGTASHFHDEYLRLTIDLHIEQQKAWMYVLRSACSARHEGSAGVEDCDGSVYFPFIRYAVVEQFKSLRISPIQSQLYAKHFLTYCEVLRQDDAVRYEQFTDAPFFINTPSLGEDCSHPDYSKGQDQRGDIEEEGAVCPLHHLALAVRMTYVVWGFDAAPSARLAVTLLPQAARKHSQLTRFASVASISRTPESDRPGAAVPSIALRAEEFAQEVKREYRDAVQRVNNGVAQHNALRHMAATLSAAALSAAEPNERPQSDAVPLGRTRSLLTRPQDDPSTPVAPPSREATVTLCLPVPLDTEQSKEDDVENSTDDTARPVGRDAAHAAHADVLRLYTAMTATPRPQSNTHTRGTRAKAQRVAVAEPPVSAASAAAVLAATAERLALPAVQSLARYLGIRLGPQPRAKGAASKKRAASRAPQDVHAALEGPCQAGHMALFAQQARLARQLADAAAAAVEAEAAAAQEVSGSASGAPRVQSVLWVADEAPQDAADGKGVGPATGKGAEVEEVLKVRASCAALSLM